MLRLDIGFNRILLPVRGEQTVGCEGGCRGAGETTAIESAWTNTGAVRSESLDVVE